MVEEVQKSYGVRFELNSMFDLEKVDRWNPIRSSAIQWENSIKMDLKQMVF
jgi:hypothetical protein